MRLTVQTPAPSGKRLGPAGRCVANQRVQREWVQRTRVQREWLQRTARFAGHAFSAMVGAVATGGLLLACSRSSVPSAKPPGAIEFIEDDYPRALAEARARAVPLFVDAWASWCHTCLSLRAYVFPDPSLRRFSSRFVWLSLDTERETNAAVVDKLGVHVLPTLFVIDPKTEAPALAWPGALTAKELASLFDEALGAAPRGVGADAALERGHRAAAAGRSDEAIADYRAALTAAPPGWIHRPEAVDSLVTQLRDSARPDCAVVAAAEAPSLPPGTALVDVLRAGIECAESDRPSLELLASRGERVAEDPSQPILADDRSDLFEHVVGSWRALDREDDARRVAATWARFLDAQAGRARSPAERTVFDSHRLSAYLALGQPERAIPMLEQSAKDFPADFNPPARLGRALLALGRNDEALAALDRALSLASGPRRLNMWSTEADAYLAKGDRAGARAALDRAVAFAGTIPLTGSYPALRDALSRRAEGLR